MNVKTSPSGAPPFARRAVSGLVWLLSSICARVPAQLAGDSKNTVSTLPLHVAPQEKNGRTKDHNNQDDPDNTRHPALLWSGPCEKTFARLKPVSHINACSGLVAASLPSRRCSTSPPTMNTSPAGSGH